MALVGSPLVIPVAFPRQRQSQQKNRWVSVRHKKVQKRQVFPWLTQDDTSSAQISSDAPETLDDPGSRIRFCLSRIVPSCEHSTYPGQKLLNSRGTNLGTKTWVPHDMTSLSWNKIITYHNLRFVQGSDLILMQRVDDSGMRSSTYTW